MAFRRRGAKNAVLFLDDDLMRLYPHETSVSLFICQTFGVQYSLGMRMNDNLLNFMIFYLLPEETQMTSNEWCSFEVSTRSF